VQAPRPLVEVDFQAEDGRALDDRRECFVATREQTLDLSLPGAPQGARHVVGRPGRPPPEPESPVVRREQSAVDPIGDELDGHLRVPAGPGDQLCGQLLRESEQRADEQRTFEVRQRAERDPPRARSREQAPELRGSGPRDDEGLVPRGAEDENPARGEELRVEQVACQLDRLRRGRQVIEPENDGALRRKTLEDPPEERGTVHRPGQLDFVGGRAGEPGSQRLGRHDAGAFEARMHVGESEAEEPEMAHQHRREGWPRPGLVREPCGERGGRAEFVRPLGEPGAQPRCADTGRTGHQHQASPPLGADRSQLRPQDIPLGLPPDERHRTQSEQAEAGSHEACRPRRGLRAAPRFGHRRRPGRSGFVHRRGLGRHLRRRRRDERQRRRRANGRAEDERVWRRIR
jgi:hypothetical protein